MDTSFQRKVFVGGLPWAVTEDNLTDYFNQYGDVVESNLVRDKSTGKIKGFGFILFSESSAVDKVLEEENHSILGRQVDVKKALPRAEQPRTEQLDRSYPNPNRGSNSNNSISVSNGDVHNNGWCKSKKIFVGGLSTITKEELSAFFGKFGNITDVVVMYDKLTQRPRGFGFITFESEEAVDTVMQKNLYKINDVSVEVKRAIPRDGNNNVHHPSNGFGGGYPYDNNANYISNYPSGYPGAYMPFYPPNGVNYLPNGYGFLPGYGMIPADHFGGAGPFYNGPFNTYDAGVGETITTDRNIGAAVNDEQNGEISEQL